MKYGMIVLTSVISFVFIMSMPYSTVEFVCSGKNVPLVCVLHFTLVFILHYRYGIHQNNSTYYYSVVIKRSGLEMLKQ